MQNRNRLTDFEKLMVTEGNRWGWGREGLGVWDWLMDTVKCQTVRRISHDITYMWILKKRIQMNLFAEQKQTHRLKNYGYQWEQVGGGEGWTGGLALAYAHRGI